MLVFSRHPHQMNHFHPYRSSDRRSASTSPPPVDQSQHSLPRSVASSSSSIPLVPQHEQQRSQTSRESRNLGSSADPNSRKRSLTTSTYRSSARSSLPHVAKDEDEEMEDEGSPQQNNHLMSTNKRTRKLLTPEQSKALHELLAKTHFPSTSAREEIARQLDITPRKVQVFFQNKRQKARRHTLSQNARQSAETSTSVTGTREPQAPNHERPGYQGYTPSESKFAFGGQLSSRSSDGAQFHSNSRSTSTTSGSHSRESSRNSSDPFSHQLHSQHTLHQQHHFPSRHHLHSKGSHIPPPLTLPSELGARPIHSARSFDQHPASLAEAPSPGSPDSSHPTAFAHLLSADPRRRAFSDAPHRLDAPPHQGSAGLSIFEERAQSEAAPRKLAPLPQGRRIELPPIPAGLTASQSSNPNSIRSPLSKIDSPPLLALQASALPPLRLNPRHDRHQEDEESFTDEDRSISSKASSQADSVDTSLNSRRQQHLRDSSLSGSSLPHPVPSSSMTARGRSDSDPFFRARGISLGLVGTPPTNEIERSGVGQGYFATASPFKSVSMSKFSRSQDSSHRSSQHHTLSPTHQSQYQGRPSSYVLPPLSSGLPTPTPPNPIQYQDLSSQSQTSSQRVFSSSQLSKRPAEALRLPSFSQLSIDVENQDRETSQEREA